VGSKKAVWKYLSKRSIVTAPARAGTPRIWITFIAKKACKKRFIFLKVIPGALMLRFVTTRFMAEAKDAAPKRCTTRA
jgi:hypothetical protein